MTPINPIYKELAAKIQGADSEIVPRILAKLANLEQAGILAALPDRDRDPAAGRSLDVSEKFAEKLNLGMDVVKKHLRELFEKGVVVPTKAGPQMARTWMQLHDATLMNPKYDESLGPEFFDLWALSQGRPRKPVEPIHDPAKSEFRVVPKWKSIKDVPGVLPHEDRRQILKSQELIVQVPCGCKRCIRDRECGIPEESCITVSRAAQYNLERGIGRKITYEQALEVLEKYEHYPTVSLVINQKSVNTLVCNCHWCCCGAVIDAAQSRFLTVTDADECQACGICEERCQFGAIQLKFDEALGRELAVVDPELCRGCGDCVLVCPHEARKMEVVRPPEQIPESRSIY